jgi:hypothetical protein
MDIKGFFDNIDHGLLVKALERHVSCKWAMLYIQRWLTVSLYRLGWRLIIEINRCNTEAASDRGSFFF